MGEAWNGSNGFKGALMNALLAQAAETLTKAAGWNPARADEKDVFHFSLENDLDFSLLSPDGRAGILLAALGPAPDAETPQGSAELERLATLAAGCLKKRSSVLSIADDNALELYRKVDLQAPSTLPDQVKDFLNDLAWWKRQIQNHGAPSAGASSPFSFSFNSWFSPG